MNEEHKKRSVTAHILIKNEDRFIWYAIMSVIEYMDRIIVFDTGSKDRTVEIVRMIQKNPQYGSKIFFEEKGEADRNRIAKLRQEMIKMTETDYFMVLDGDEIWWENSIREAISILNQKSAPPLLAQHYVQCAKDIWHYRDPKRDLYTFLDKEKAATIRFYSMSIPGIHCGGCYGIEGFFDKDNNEVQCGKYMIGWQEGTYFHTSFLKRSSRQIADIFVYSRLKKLFPRYDYSLPSDYVYPEVFYREHPRIVRDPFKKEWLSLRMVIYFLLDTLHLRNLIERFRKK